MIIRKSLAIIGDGRHIVLVAIILSLCTSPTTSLAPPDHLVPPPLPPSQRLTTQVPGLPIVSAPATASPIVQAHATNNDNAAAAPGFMTRIARWFGFGPDGEPREQQLTPNSGYKVLDNGKRPYGYPQSNHPGQLTQGHNDKANCGNCNEYPWVPMLPPGFQYPLREQRQEWIQPPTHQNHHKNNLEQTSQQQLKRDNHRHYQHYHPHLNYLALPHQQQPQLAPLKQRAVQFNIPRFTPVASHKGSGNFYLTPPMPSRFNKFSLTSPPSPRPPPLPFVPIPVPNLSASALPPLYNAQPFRSFVTSTAPSHTEQQLPTTERAHFVENVGAHSEQQLNSVYPTQIPPTITNVPSHEPSFEIIKSHQLTDFVSSVEYPTTFVQSQSFDVTGGQLPSNHKMGPDHEQAHTVRYQHETLDPRISDSHVPASQLLTEVGNFGSVVTPPHSEFSTLPTMAYEQVTSIYPTQPQFATDLQSQNQDGNNALTFYDSLVTDNYPSASSNNFSAVQDSNREDLLPKWSADMFSSIQKDEFYYPITTSTTQSPQFLPTTTTEIVLPETKNPFQGEINEVVTEGLQDIEIDFLPSVQTEYIQRQKLQRKHQQHQQQQEQQQQQQLQQHQQQQKQQRQQSQDSQPQVFYKKTHRDRETPKRLLDAPIAHFSNSVYPFTRDPSELHFRQGTKAFQPQEFRYPNHAYTRTELPSQQSQQSTSSWSVTSAPNQTYSNQSAAPTPTSTYGALDASGQFADMSAPPPAAVLPQIIVPYTTKNRPRPFAATHFVESSKLIAPHQINGVSHDHSKKVGIQVQEESQHIGSATTTNVDTRTSLNQSLAKPRTNTKYLTRILASNLRELLKREHETKDKTTVKPESGIDLLRLQKNIDDWTEQEYTSLSHRASTPTIRGRSKNIPPEYLITTIATPRQAKTTHNFDVAELSSSINNLEPLLKDHGSKRFEYPSVDDNRVLDYNYEPQLSKKRSTTSTTPKTTTTATTIPVTSMPSTNATMANETNSFYIRAVPTEAPTELWEKARVSISPQTKERIYVVTPQPRFSPQRLLANRTSGLTDRNEKEEQLETRSFKSPRFLIRPTPGSGSFKDRSTTSSSSLHTSDLFGLVGLSAYVPSEPVEIIDGNSKVYHSKSIRKKQAS